MRMTMTMTDLFPDLITGILCRLPVKSLLRFRCVSKAWCSEIDGGDFIKLHLNHSVKTNTNLSLILRHVDYRYSSVDLDTLNTLHLLRPGDLFALFKFHGGDFLWGAHVVGSCNGLIALFNFHSHTRHNALWNPSTREFHILPPTLELPPGDFIDPMATAFGFGYDPVSDDYKLVRIVPYYESQKKSQVTVYSLKSNSWRRTRDFPYHLQRKGVLAHNTLHWMVSKDWEGRTWRSANQIVAFDLRTEQYFEVPQPDYVDTNFHLYIDSLGGCFCVGCFYFKVRADIWIMKEYGVKESWTKHISVAIPEVNYSYIYYGFVRTLAYSKTGDHKVLLDKNDEEFFWYDLKRGEKVEIHVPNSKSSEMEIYVGSLVPLNAGNRKRKRGDTEE